ncbi:repulsive guidance molecule A-like isoform X2 [Amphiura filiformis]
MGIRSRLPHCAAATSTRFQLRPRPVATLLQFMLVAWLTQAVRSDWNCKAVKPCSMAYASAIDTITPAADVPYCRVLSNYNICVSSIPPRSCRGDLNYHSTRSIIRDFMINYNCTYILEQDRLRSLATTARPTVAPVPPVQEGTISSPEAEEGGHLQPKVTPPPSVERPFFGRCEYQGNKTYRHCGLFGDPHLRTFNDQFQTCRIAGAWPLIYNEYLAVQVTNVPLVHGSGATATNKLSIIIKDHDECAERKLYQAQSGNLPAYFVDGTQEAGYGHSVLIADIVPGEHVEIHIKYIATVIVIRQQGAYLQFAIRMPEDLIHGINGEDDTQLCVRGCPLRERIDYKDFMQDFLTEKSQRQSSVDQCRDANVINDYLDSCVFDLLTTGDQNFTKAAQHAMMDLNRLHPKASVILKNRTSVFENEELYNLVTTKSGACGSGRTNCLLRLQLVLCLFVLLLVRQTTTCVT